MCDPISLTAAGLTVAAGVMRGMTNRANVNAQREVERAAYERSKAARLAEQQRQQGFEAESSQNWENTRDALDKQSYDQNQAGAVQDFLDTVQSRPSAVVPEGFLLSGQGSATTEVSQEIARRAAAAAADAKARIAALAKLSSYDTAALDGNLALSSNADLLTTINNMRRGSLSASQYEQSIPAAQVIPGDNTLADILSGIGGTVAGGSWSYGLPVLNAAKGIGPGVTGAAAGLIH